MRNANRACETLRLGFDKPSPNSLVLSVGHAREVLENKIDLGQPKLLYIVLKKEKQI